MRAQNGNLEVISIYIANLKAPRQGNFQIVFNSKPEILAAARASLKILGLQASSSKFDCET